MAIPWSDVLFHSAAGGGGEAVVAPPFPAGAGNLGLTGPMPGDGNATCLLIGRQEKGDRATATLRPPWSSMTSASTALTVLPAPAVAMDRTPKSFDEGGQAERLDGTESGENTRTPNRPAQAAGVQLGVRGATRYIRARLNCRAGDSVPAPAYARPGGRRGTARVGSTAVRGGARRDRGRAGDDVLDLGCGAGLFARAAADRGARVTGIDTDPAAVARAAAEVPEGSVRRRGRAGPAAGPFDVVAAVQLLMHVADPVAVLAACGGAGAVVAATVWGREEECDVRVFGEALAPWLGPRGRRPGRRRSPTHRLRALAERAGLVVERVEEVVCPFEYADEDELLGPLFDSALGRSVARRAGPVAVRAAVLTRLEPYRTAAGGYRLENLFRVLVGAAGPGPTA